MPLPVLSVAEMRAWEESTWKGGETAERVIARVGEKLAGRILDLCPPGSRVLILAGRGHNGDDARAAVSHLIERDAKVVNLSEPAEQLSELREALAAKPALVIDALFGIGLNRPLDESWRAVIEAVNSAGLETVAVDCPSGLNCDTGEPQPIAIRADLTLTLGAPKRGLLSAGASEFTGQLEAINDIGLAEREVDTELRWTMDDDFAEWPPRRAVSAHKGSFGHVLVVGGSEGYHGAAVLASRAARRALAGLVSVVTTSAAYPAVAAQVQAAMVHVWVSGFRAPDKISSAVFGPGCAAVDFPTDLTDFCLNLWCRAAFPVVVDATGLEWIKDAPVESDAPRVITPHPGEAARLLGTTAGWVQRDRPAAARELGARFPGCIIVLKGHQTLVTRQGGPLFVNSTGGPLLAQGGTGDVLAGFLGGLLAQSRLREDAMRTVRYGVWRHGRASDGGWDGDVETLPDRLR